MKTGNISQGGSLLRQANLIREDKAPKKGLGKPIKEGLDFSMRASSLMPHVPPTYDEVIELLYGTNFSRLKDIEWISQEGRSSLRALV